MGPCTRWHFPISFWHMDFTHLLATVAGNTSFGNWRRIRIQMLLGWELCYMSHNHHRIVALVDLPGHCGQHSPGMEIGLSHCGTGQIASWQIVSPACKQTHNRLERTVSCKDDTCMNLHLFHRQKSNSQKTVDLCDSKGCGYMVLLHDQFQSILLQDLCQNEWGIVYLSSASGLHLSLLVG